ncbi:MAG: hypothetical protein KR126chlam6_01526, partial [Candidatus Anoxychlamydiales bacterium]|nr:hypothetical protein [Candidatus Anoxychlamydiales bacterium]
VNASWGDSNLPYIVHAAGSPDPEFALNVVKELVKRGADVNLSDSSGWSALFRSSLENTHIKVTKFLLKKGAIIYEQAREYIFCDPEHYSNELKEDVQRQPGNLARAINEIVSINMFRNGVLSKGESVISCLPAEIREHICSFLD